MTGVNVLMKEDAVKCAHPAAPDVAARGHCLQTRKLVLPRHHLRQGLMLVFPDFKL